MKNTNKPPLLLIIYFLGALLLILQTGERAVAQKIESATLTNEVNQLNDEINKKKDEIEELQKQIEKQKAEIEKKRNESTTLKNQINVIENQIAKSQLDISTVKKQIEAAKLSGEAVSLEIRLLDSKIETEKKFITAVIRQLYIEGEKNYLKILTQNESFYSYFIDYTAKFNKTKNLAEKYCQKTTIDWQFCKIKN